MRWILTLAILGVVAGSLCAQDAQSGWKVVKDQQGVCQLTVPSNWKADTVTASFVKSPDGKLNAQPSGAAAGQSFRAVALQAKQMMPPLKVIEDSAHRVWFAYAGRSPEGGENWYVAVAGDPVCQAQITYKLPSVEETAQKIALSLAHAENRTQAAK
jgi:hypothetical protein